MNTVASTLNEPSLILPYVILFIASFSFIFLKAFQQRSVAHANYPWILPTSYAIATVEIFVIANIAQQGWSWFLVLLIGTGAGLGATLATYIHCRYIKKTKNTKDL